MRINKKAYRELKEDRDKWVREYSELAQLMKTRENELKEENEQLKETVKHLKACNEFESNLQNEILAIGVPLIDAPDGTTISVDRAWRAIQRALKGNENE